MLIRIVDDNGNTAFIFEPEEKSWGPAARRKAAETRRLLAGSHMNSTSKERSGPPGMVPSDHAKEAQRPQTPVNPQHATDVHTAVKKLAGKHGEEDHPLENDKEVGVIANIKRPWAVSGAVAKQAGVGAWLGMRMLTPDEKQKVRDHVKQKTGKWTAEHEDILSAHYSNPNDLAEGRGLAKGYSKERATTAYDNKMKEAALAAQRQTAANTAGGYYYSTVSNKSNAEDLVSYIFDRVNKSMYGSGNAPVSAAIAARKQKIGVGGSSSRLMGLAKKEKPIQSRLAMGR